MPVFSGILPCPEDVTERLQAAGFRAGLREFIPPLEKGSLPDDCLVYIGDVQYKGRRRVLVLVGAGTILAFGMELPYREEAASDQALATMHELLGLNAEQRTMTPQAAENPQLHLALTVVGEWFGNMIRQWTDLD